MTTPSYASLLQLFHQPPLDYSDFVTWFWETGELDKERLTWQLEELKKKGVGGTWYYPRYLDGERYGTQPAYFSEEWWEFFRHSVAEHERLGLEAWFSGWEGREYWQDLLRAERATRPELEGRRLAIHEARSNASGAMQLDVPPERDGSDGGGIPLGRGAAGSGIAPGSQCSCAGAADKLDRAGRRLAAGRGRQPAPRSRLPHPPCRRALSRNLLAGTRRAAARICTRHPLPLRAG